MVEVRKDKKDISDDIQYSGQGSKPWTAEYEAD
jgi:hypothetical protein